MPKRKDIIKRIAKAARANNTEWVLDREGANHTIYRLGGEMIPIPRHNEIGERITEDIYKECAEVLGKDWWR